MKRIFIIFTVLWCASISFVGVAQRSQRLTNEDRQKWLTEMRNLKHDFLTRELSLTREQQTAFFPIYDEMEDELNRINTETRNLERKVKSSANVSDAEYDEALRTIYGQKQREGTVEMAYYEKFKTILKPEQLLGLKDAERKFTRQLVKGHKQLQPR